MSLEYVYYLHAAFPCFETPVPVLFCSGLLFFFSSSLVEGVYYGGMNGIKSLNEDPTYLCNTTNILIPILFRKSQVFV